jgi:hypothetical protein
VKRDRPTEENAGEIVPVGPLECALVAEARSGRIGCASVFRIAEAQGVPVATAGRAVQRLRIKLTGCQMGCF